MKRKVIIFLLLLCLVSVTYAKSDLRVIKPIIGFTPDLSPTAQKEWDEGKKVYLKLASGEKEESLSKEEKRLLNKYDDTKESIWDILGEGDNWYNAGGPYKVEATSELKSQGGNDYGAKNVHDLSFATDYNVVRSLVTINIAGNIVINIWLNGKPKVMIYVI